jgi:hypothetical protein
MGIKGIITIQGVRSSRRAVAGRGQGGSVSYSDSLSSFRFG